MRMCPRGGRRLPADSVEGLATIPSPALSTGPALFAPRRNSQGWDLTDTAVLAGIEAARAPHMTAEINAALGWPGGLRAVRGWRS
jgi:delta 1-pyrroline-5-carboxylate dehydrogenase